METTSDDFHLPQTPLSTELILKVCYDGEHGVKDGGLLFIDDLLTLR